MTIEEVVANLRAGRSGLQRARLALPFATYWGALPSEPAALPHSLAPYDTRLARIAVTALRPILGPVRAACERWGRGRVAMVLGSSTAGLDTTERAFREQLGREGELPAWYSIDTQHDFAAVTHVLRDLTGIAGPCAVVSTACSSAGKAFGSARRLLLSGSADAVLVGGVDALCELTLRGFHSLGVLSSEPCRPFSAARTGVSIGEGAALFLLERDADADIHLLGVGESNDAHHMTAPHPEGAGAEASMRAALADAGLVPDDIDHVNAHATGTELNDRSEALAIARVFGAQMPTVATKGYTGHALGSAGAIEAALCIASLVHRVRPASIGAQAWGDGPALDVVLCEQAIEQRRVLSNSFAFGGSNVSLVFGALQ